MNWSVGDIGKANQKDVRFQRKTRTALGYICLANELATKLEMQWSRDLNFDLSITLRLASRAERKDLAHDCLLPNLSVLVVKMAVVGTALMCVYWHLKKQLVVVLVPHLQMTLQERGVWLHSALVRMHPILYQEYRLVLI